MQPIYTIQHALSVKSFVALVNLVGLSLSKDISHCGQDCACGRLLWTATATRVAAWPSWRASSAHSPSTDTTQLSPSPGWAPELGMARTLPRQRDHAFKPNKLVVYALWFKYEYVVATSFRHRGLNIFHIFLSLKLFYVFALRKKIVLFPALLLNI